MDLMLGRMGGPADWSFNRIEDPKVSLMESSSSSGSSKRAKAPSTTSHVVSCLVDGCSSDLSQCREYHRRHKVCERHSKTPKVTIGGQEQRFCQQCSRFHSLVEFDEGKRSCRKRLEGHNRRRRKPQSESLSRNPGRFLSNQQGPTLLSFSSSQLFGSPMMNSAWAETVNAENSTLPYNSNQCLNYIGRHDDFLGSLPHSFGGGNQFKIFHGNNLPDLSEASTCQPLLDPSSASGTSSHSQKIMFSDGLSRAIVESDCALSLLSSAPPAETREIGLGHVVQPNPGSSAQSLAHNMHYCDLSQYSQGIESKPLASFLSSHAGDNADLHRPGMFQDGPDGPSDSGRHQTLSFRWE